MDALAECAQSKAEEQNCGENRFGEMHTDLLSDGSVRLMERRKTARKMVGIERQALSSHAYNASGDSDKSRGKRLQMGCSAQRLVKARQRLKAVKARLAAEKRHEKRS